MHTDLTYWYGLFDPAARELRGFRVVQTGDGGGALRTSWFHQDAVRKGKVELAQTETPAGSLLSITSDTWRCVEIPTLAPTACPAAATRAAYGLRLTESLRGDATNGVVNEWVVLRNLETMKEHRPLRYEATHPHQISAVAADGAVTHDANGNRTAAAGRVFAYDAEDRLVAVDGGAVAFAYDHAGRRTVTVSAGHVRCHFGRLLEAAGGTLTKYYYAGPLLVAILMCPRAAPAEVENVPAYRVESEKVAPRTSEFDWHAMHFVSPTHGWFVGCPLVLEVYGDDLRLWLVGRKWWVTLMTIDAVDESNVSAGGTLRYWLGPGEYFKVGTKSGGLFLHWGGAGWTAVETTGVPSLDVDVFTLALAGTDGGWAIASFALDPKQYSTLLLRFDGRTWQPQPPTWPLGFQWSMSDLCLTRDGGGDGVHRDGARRHLAGRSPASTGRDRYFMHYSGGRWDRWERVAGPVLPPDLAQRYIVKQIQFVSPTEAWAIASGQGGGALSRGLIFDYKNGVWWVRNWSWNWWDEKWLGLVPTSH